MLLVRMVIWKQWVFEFYSSTVHVSVRSNHNISLVLSFAKIYFKLKFATKALVNWTDIILLVLHKVLPPIKNLKNAKCYKLLRHWTKISNCELCCSGIE